VTEVKNGVAQYDCH